MNLQMNWITLRVRDLESSLAFYHGILGLTVERRFESRGRRIAMLGSPGQPKLELIETGSEAALRPGSGISIGFETESLEGTMERLNGCGVPVSRGPIAPRPDLRFFYVLDPDGFEVQLAHHG
ncbi:VOC family protein [Paenibacillus spiritus]|uniref:VOC family protein n=1 Tax=Paenibacillus spiritus TaxID=2496557 RepID=A0A5J5FZX8_9BACL|nr:VOC family protein [Paenibacillus spiritus]KAA8999745.1 VOC family protein [Paenibacillus spiritus]